MKVVISGYGKMGHMIEAVLKRRGIECAGASEDIVNFDDALAKECVCIDFTTPDAFRANYPALARKFKAVVIGTTGWNDIHDEVLACFEQAGTPMIWSSNYSIGVNVLFAAVERASELLKGHGYEPHVHEIHHIHKLDSPSGTAKSIAKLVEEGIGEAPEITAERIGEVPGIHTVTYLSGCDKLTFTHEAFSREGFAEGAVAAAVMADTLEGIHEFKELILK
ncbi:MAG: 4-hydroxy-tetrahydrodipicolinate reductase [Bacteroidales bacterium]|nr:4-hydroxy-tetrahydrodipicolinate reductase [Bacteroidales bacterium]